jgi:APA family basic amino acid/polyamine antiporter
VVNEAKEMRASAVVLTLPRRRSGGVVFGATVETVLTERPCRVIIEADPTEQASPPSPRPAGAARA